MQPLVDEVLAVVALPVGEAGAGHGGAEARGLGDGPHAHVAAVAPAGDADAVVVDRQRLHGFIHAAEDVAEIAVAEVADVCLCESLAEAQAAAGIGEQDKIPGGGEHTGRAGGGPVRALHASGTAVNPYHHGPALRGIVTARIEKPALHGAAFGGPVEALRLAPLRRAVFRSSRRFCAMRRSARPRLQAACRRCGAPQRSPCHRARGTRWEASRSRRLHPHRARAPRCGRSRGRAP